MSSVIFQPLLHDPLGWKSTKSTYADHYKWKKYRSASKDKKKLTKYSQHQNHHAVPTTAATPITTITSTEQTIKPIVLTNKTEENRGRTSALRSASAKTPVTEHIEEKIRPVSVHEVSAFYLSTSDLIHILCISRVFVFLVLMLTQTRNSHQSLMQTMTIVDIG